jgi:hypothetical protein
MFIQLSDADARAIVAAKSRSVVQAQSAVPESEEVRRQRERYEALDIAAEWIMREAKRARKEGRILDLDACLREVLIPGEALI